MAETPIHRPGSFCWADLATTDTEAAKEFYLQLFGWTSIDNTIDYGLVYSNFLLNGKPVAGLSEPIEEHKRLNLPPSWNAYICTANADETLSKAVSAGAIVIMAAQDIMDEVRIGMFRDPEGVDLGVMQLQNHKGFGIRDIHGAPCWLEYASHDSDSTISFYGKVFGWTAKTEEIGEMQYTIFLSGDDMVAGLFKLPPRLSEVPSHWLPYYVVEGLESAIEFTNRSGGSVLMAPVFVEGIGTYGRIRDPQGGIIGLIQV